MGTATRIGVLAAHFLLALGAATLGHAQQFANNQDFVSQQYRDVLRREADPSALSYWSSQPRGPAVIRSLVESSEVQANQGAIVRLYFGYFDRMPDYGGFSFWHDRYASGLATLTSISAAFASSPEFWMTYGPLDNTQFVRLVYNNVLNRDPDSGGLSYWVGQLSNGMPRHDLMLAFSESAEHQSLRWNDVAQFIVHARMLQSAPASFQPGADLNSYISTLLNSPGYASRIGNRLASLALQDCGNTLPVLGPTQCVTGDMASRLRRKNVAGYGVTDATQFNSLSMELRYFGSGITQNAVSYDPNNRTGLSIPVSERSSFQRGQYDIGEPTVTPVAQLYRDRGGVVLNTWWIDSQPIIGGGINSSYGVTWQIPGSVTLQPYLQQLVTQEQPGRVSSYFPGTAAFPSLDSQLMVQANLKIPTSIRWINSQVARIPGRPSAQTYFFLYFLDRTIGDVIPMVIGVYDINGRGPDTLLCEQIPNSPCRAFASIYLPQDGAFTASQYITPSPFSRGFNGGGLVGTPIESQNSINDPATWSDERFFRFHVTRLNLLRLVRALNMQRPAGSRFSEDPSQYLLVDAGLQSEVVYDRLPGADPTNPNHRDNVSFAYSFGGFGVWKLQ